jgi:cytolysin (calcineurin-like family phosphatase)
MQTRRQFIRRFSLSTAALGLVPRGFAQDSGIAPPADAASFFLVGDTHYRAGDEDFSKMDATSAEYNARLVDWLNKLPGTAISAEAGGGSVPSPHGVIHAGDLVDNGDKAGPKAKMAETELTAFLADWGLNGGDARLRWPVREVHGNHDGPRGDTAVVEEIKARNKRRAGLTNVSKNGLHYSWDWAGVHFVALGIVVGDAPEVTRKRRYAPLGSLPFLQQDLAEHVGTSGRPVVLVHHVDVARYCEPVADDVAEKKEWDFGDVHAYYATLKPYRIAASLCGHTHARNLFRWNGTKDTKAAEGSPFLNTDNAGHFSGPTQAFLNVEVTPKELRVREFFTKDGWETGAWTPQVWKFALSA